MPTLRQIEYLVAIADTQHFRKAAEKVGVSQPTLSAQLSALEQTLGVQLVERSRSSVLVTPVGELILTLGRRMLRDAQEVNHIARSSRGEFGGLIRLGLPPTIGPYLLPKVLPQLHRAYPDMKIYVREQPPSALPSALGEGLLDVALAPLPIPGADFESVPMFREPLFLCAPDDHPLASKGYVERSDLSGQAVLALEPGHQLHEQVAALCEEFGAKMMFDYEGTSLETLRQMTALGMGVSFLPGLFVSTTIAPGGGVTPLELRGRSLNRTIGMVWRRTSARRREYQVLLEYVALAIENDFPSFTRL